MEARKTPDCNCHESKHDTNYDLDHNNRSCSSCCQRRCDCCCNCNRHRCRKDLCDDHFRIRLAGLTDGLNYRLHQLLWSEVAITLDNGEYVVGTIVFVGSNFVEMLLPSENGKPFEEFELEDGLTPEPDDGGGTAARTLIFPISEIKSIESDSFSFEE